MISSGREERERRKESEDGLCNGRVNYLVMIDTCTYAEITIEAEGIQTVTDKRRDKRDKKRQESPASACASMANPPRSLRCYYQRSTIAHRSWFFTFSPFHLVYKDEVRQHANQRPETCLCFLQTLPWHHDEFVLDLRHGCDRGSAKEAVLVPSRQVFRPQLQ